MKRFLIITILFATSANAQVQIFSKESDTAVTRLPFKLVDVTDNETAETGITISGSECQFSKNGASFADCGGTITEVGSGYYHYVPASTEINTPGYLVLKISDAAANSEGILAQIVKYGQNTAQAGSSTTITLAAAESYGDNVLAECQAVCVVAGTGKGQCRDITANVLSTDVVTVSPAWGTNPDSTSDYNLYTTCGSSGSQIASAVWDASRASYTTAGTFGQGAASVQGNVTGSVGSVTASVTTSSAANNAIADQVWDEVRSGHVTAGTFGAGVVVNTNSDKSGYTIAGTKTSLDSLNDLSNANVLTQVNSGLASYDAPTKTEMDFAFTEIKGATWSSVTDTLEQISNGGGGGGGGSCDNEAIADAVWDELLAGHVVSGSASDIIGDALNTTLTCEATRLP